MRQNTEKPTFRSICRSSLAQSMFSQRVGLLQNIRRGKFSFVKRWMKIKSKDDWKSKVVWKLRDDWNFTSIGELYWWIFLNGFTSAQSCLCSRKTMLDLIYKLRVSLENYPIHIFFHLDFFDVFSKQWLSEERQQIHNNVDPAQKCSVISSDYLMNVQISEFTGLQN